MYSPDWNDLITGVSWLINDNDIVEVSSSRMAYDGYFQPTSEFLNLFPTLSKLLNMGRVTEAKINGETFLIYGWTNRDNISFGWQCLPRTSMTKNTDLHPHHALLLSCFGGIKEHWNEPLSWLLNHNSVLSEKDVVIGFCGWEDYYFDLCNEMQINPYVSPTDYRTFAREANGNCTMYHKVTGQVLMFAHDHYFDHIKPLRDSPEYTLYTINDCPDFRTWVEIVARQWLVNVKNED